MLKVNTILLELEIDPAKVFLVRHENKLLPESLYKVWKERRQDFET